MGHRAHSRFLVIAGGNGIFSVHGYPHRTHGSPDICQAITDSLHTGRAGAACSSSFPVCYRFQVHNVRTFSQNALGDDFPWDTKHTKPPKAHIHRPAVKRQRVVQAEMHKIKCDVVHLCTCAPVYLCTCVPVYLCTCVPVYLCTCVPVYLCTCV